MVASLAPLTQLGESDSATRCSFLRRRLLRLIGLGGERVSFGLRLPGRRRQLAFDRQDRVTIVRKPTIRQPLTQAGKTGLLIVSILPE
ncbi:MAG: hypothetical protein H6R17_1589 [Proteobacteria bacterium]|nr:hypothetical protein [Pseudomonadota bacterium]